MEGKERVMRSYKGGCCRRTPQRFMEKKIKVKTAHPPGIIMWENLNTSKIARFFRILLVAIITLILVAITFAINVYAKNREKDFKKFAP